MIDEPLGAAHRDHNQMAARLKMYLIKTLRELVDQPTEKLLAARYDKFRRMGQFLEPDTPATNGEPSLKPRPLAADVSAPTTQWSSRTVGTRLAASERVGVCRPTHLPRVQGDDAAIPDTRAQRPIITVMFVSAVVFPGNIAYCCLCPMTPPLPRRRPGNRVPASLRAAAERVANDAHKCPTTDPDDEDWYDDEDSDVDADTVPCPECGAAIYDDARPLPQVRPLAHRRRPPALDRGYSHPAASASSPSSSWRFSSSCSWWAVWACSPRRGRVHRGGRVDRTNRSGLCRRFAGCLPP